MFTLTRMLVLATLCLLMGMACGCAETPKDAEAESAPSSPIPDESGSAGDQMPAGDDAADPPIQYDGPKFDFSIEIMESMPEQYALTWNVTANSGGWTLTTDDVKRTGSSVEVYLTLVRPGPDEIVTQALVTLRGKHDAGTAEIARAELHVRFIPRGSKDDPPYLLAAIAP